MHVRSLFTYLPFASLLPIPSFFLPASATPSRLLPDLTTLWDTLGMVKMEKKKKVETYTEMQY